LLELLTLALQRTILLLDGAILLGNALIGLSLLGLELLDGIECLVIVVLESGLLFGLLAVELLLRAELGDQTLDDLLLLLTGIPLASDDQSLLLHGLLAALSLSGQVAVLLLEALALGLERLVLLGERLAFAIPLRKPTLSFLGALLLSCSLSIGLADATRESVDIVDAKAEGDGEGVGEDEADYDGPWMNFRLVDQREIASVLPVVVVEILQPSSGALEVEALRHW